jgi:hypothetical protein
MIMDGNSVQNTSGKSKKENLNNYGGLAQVGERLPYKQQAEGSTPSALTTTLRKEIMCGLQLKLKM